MNLRKYLFHQSGFSLVEITLGLALMSGLGLAIAQLFRDQNRAITKNTHDSELSVFHNKLSETMSTAANCNATLKKLFPTSSAISSVDVTTLYICNPATTLCADDNSESDLSFDAYTTEAYEGEEYFKVGDYIDRVAAISATANKEIWMIQAMRIMGSKTESGTIRLRITYQKNPRIAAQSGNNTTAKDIILSVRMFDGKFKECMNPSEANLVNAQRDLCKSLNPDESTTLDDGEMALWNEEKQTCIVSGVKDCSSLPGFSIDGLNSEGKLTCKSTIHSTDASAIANSTLISCPSNNYKLQFNSTTKKIGVVCAP